MWPGGEWHLRDITSYMTTAAFELLKHAAQNRVAWLKRFYAVGREAVRTRRPARRNGVHSVDVPCRTLGLRVRTRASRHSQTR